MLHTSLGGRLISALPWVNSQEPTKLSPGYGVNPNAKSKPRRASSTLTLAANFKSSSVKNCRPGSRSSGTQSVSRALPRQRPTWLAGALSFQKSRPTKGVEVPQDCRDARLYTRFSRRICLRSAPRTSSYAQSLIPWPRACFTTGSHCGTLIRDLIALVMLQAVTCLCLKSRGRV